MPRPDDQDDPPLFRTLPGESRTSRTSRRTLSERSAGKWINAHCDGGARGNPGPAGYGALITDDAGNTLAELSQFIGIRTNNFAEYSGLLGCLGFALKHQHPRLRVTSDSELMVKQIQGRYQVKSPDLRPLFEEAKRRIAQLEAFEITHALRHKNKAADALANQAMDRGIERRRERGTNFGPDGLNRRVTDAPTLRPIGVRPKIAELAAQLATPNRPAPPPRQAEAFPEPPPAAATPASRPASTPVSRPSPAAASPAASMLRGVARDGVVHLLGSAALPDGTFVKIICE